MGKFLRRLYVSSLDELGRCLFCIRAALMSAIAGWVATAALVMISPGAFVTIVVAMTAVALTVLWAAHLTAHALRVTYSRRGRVALIASVRSQAPTRREMTKIFLGAFIGLAMASVFVASTRRAHAADEGCTEATPSACGTAYCCSGPARWYCQGYTGYAEPWRTMVNFCTNADSNEDIADLRSNCAILTAC